MICSAEIRRLKIVNKSAHFPQQRYSQIIKHRFEDHNIHIWGLLGTEWRYKIASNIPEITNSTNISKQQMPYYCKSNYQCSTRRQNNKDNRHSPILWSNTQRKRLHEIKWSNMAGPGERQQVEFMFLNDMDLVNASTRKDIYRSVENRRTRQPIANTRRWNKDTGVCTQSQAFSIYKLPRNRE